MEFTETINAELLPALGETARVALILAVAITAALALHFVAARLLRRLARTSESDVDEMILSRLGGPLRWAFVAVAVAMVADAIPVLREPWEAIAGFAVPALLGWFALALVRAFRAAMIVRADITVADNLQARRRRTRVAILSRIATFIIIFVTVALMLLSIPGVRSVGVTLMASAGLAGLAVGAAAQPALRSLIAGVQMAFTEPIRIEDVVIIEGEWGWIEEIRTTYVIVRVWDQRRLVVPVSKFLDEGFQNWTRKTAELLGTVFFYVDPATDVDRVREELVRVTEANKRWDGRVAILQVTNTSADNIELRGLISAQDAPTLWDLRCEVREAVMDFLRRDYPEAIVRRRVEMAEPDAAAGGELAAPVAGS